MLASVAWLRSLASVEADVKAIADALTARGLTVDAIEPSGDDHALDIDIPANRPDCLGHLGLARELAAAFGTSLDTDHPEPWGGPGEVGGRVRVDIEAPELCGRFTATLVEGIRVGPSPEWVVRRLQACGLRSINNVVDASNLVMLELGNPVHFFDYSTVAGQRIRVRRAGTGEKLTTLDDVERELDEEMIVIADGERGVGLGGVMGGANTEIRDTTRYVLVEVAWFEPDSIRRTARRLGLHTDASHRFERGADPLAVATAQALCTKYLVELCGGTPVEGMVDVFPRTIEPGQLRLRESEVARLLGFTPEPGEIESGLERLALRPERSDEGAFRVTVPTWRFDLEREADLVEEVGRHLGYDRIPSSMSGLPAEAVGAVRPPVEESVRDRLAHRGFHEAYGYAMIADDEDLPWIAGAADRPAMALTHPITETLARLRRSILPGLLRAATLNQRRGNVDVRLFEIGCVFHAATGDGAFPAEPRRVGIAWAGSGSPRHWSSATREVDLYDLIGLVEDVFGDVTDLSGLTRRSADRSGRSGFHPGQSLEWLDERGTVVGWAGMVHPERQERRALPIWMAEFDLDRLDADQPPVARYRTIPNLGSVSRDLAVVLHAELPYDRVIETLRSVAAPCAVRFEAIDRYDGAPLAGNEYAVTIRLTLQPGDLTLTEDQIEGYRRQVLQALQDAGISLRG